MPHTETAMSADEIIEKEWALFNSGAQFDSPPASPLRLVKPPNPPPLDVDLPRYYTAPEVALVHPSGVTWGAEDGVCAVGVKRSAPPCLRELRAIEAQNEKIARKSGAIIAPSRTGEGFKLPSGNQRTCLPDAAYAGLCILSPDFKAASLARLRRLSVPVLGNEQEASWATLADAFLSLQLPFALREVTSHFKVAGGPFLNLLKAHPGVYVVSLCVTIDGLKNNHAVALSTIPEKHAPSGKLVDNHAQAKPVYLEQKDTRGREAAKKAWHKFLLQNPSANSAETFEATIRDVYQLETA